MESNVSGKYVLLQILTNSVWNRDFVFPLNEFSSFFQRNLGSCTFLFKTDDLEGLNNSDGTYK